MQIQTDPSTRSLATKPKKEMLALEFEPGTNRPLVKINYSSLELIQTCKRKAKYALLDELRSTEESPATLFGSGIHKGLEVWYTLDRKSRRSTCMGECEKSGTLCANCSSIAAFRRSVTALETLDFSDKRHPNNGEKMLRAYFSKFFDDPFEVVCGADGLPLVEKRFEFVLVDEPHVKITVFGTIDLVLRNTETGVTLVCDHKTTSSLGTEFYQRINPNHQYTCYVMGAQRVLGIDTDLFLVNGLQVAKTKSDCARQITTRNQESFDEFTMAVRFAVQDFLQSVAQDRWPMNAPNPCTMYGGCQYRAICEAPKSIRDQIVKNLYGSQS